MADSHERVPHTFRRNAEKLRAQGDMRDMVEAQCGHCGFSWTACVIGRCPRCHTDTDITELRRLMVGVPRV